MALVEPVAVVWALSDALWDSTVTEGVAQAIMSDCEVKECIVSESVGG